MRLAQQSSAVLQGLIESRGESLSFTRGYDGVGVILLGSAMVRDVVVLEPYEGRTMETNAS